MAHARLIYCALLLLVASVVGCRSGAERDIVQRELRQQEDQIYALEDYLQEYQQLLCDARAENAALKRQVVQGQFREGGPTRSSEEVDTLPSPPATAPTPSPEAPPLDLSAPDVPPLDASSAAEPEQIADYAIEQASAEMELADEEIEVVAVAPTAVVLNGEVLVDANAPDTDDSGPRVLLNVAPVDGEGQRVAFHGKLSVLVLDPAAPEKSRQLARWDFAPDDLADMTGGLESSSGFELPLQLPTESPRTRPLELWVRLLPEDGEKLLGRTTMDLSRSGRFASADVKPPAVKSPPSRHVAQVAAAELPVEPPRRSRVTILDTNVEQSSWQIAKPGESAGRPASTRSAVSEWKIATRPIPESEPMPLAQSKAVVTVPAARNADRYQVADAPAWSPKRSDAAPPSSPPVDHIVPPPGPSWSPDRFTR